MTACWMRRVPAVRVYLVSPARIATAACIAASVAEGRIRATFSETGNGPCGELCWGRLAIVYFSLVGMGGAGSMVERLPRARKAAARLSAVAELSLHARLDRGRDESVNRAAELVNLFDEARADVGVILRGHHEDRLDARFEPPVHEGHLQLVLVVRDGADAAHDGVRLLLDRVLDEQPLKEIDAQAAPAGRRLLQHILEHLAPLVDGEERPLFRVDEDGDDDLVEELRAAPDDVEVAV